MSIDRDRLVAVWRRIVAIAWPVSVQQAFNTAMRTTDIIVTGLFSPAAVAALGLADLYARLPHRVGQGLAGGAIALSSQDTGSGATANRDEAITQALLLGFLTGVPFVAFGLLFARDAIAVLGASPEVSRLGGVYLTIIFAVGPARHVGLVGTAALQGTGDTRTPMVIEASANTINIVGSVVLGLGIGPAPRLAIVGVGIATAVARVFTAVAVLVAIASDRTVPGFGRPRSPVITRQLVAISVPRFLEGLSTTAIGFPFNALLLTFGTEVNAAYHIGVRMRQQFTGPFYRAYNTAASILVGQSLGAGDAEAARFNGWAAGGISALTLGAIGVFVVVFADWLVLIFTRDPATLAYGVDFARTFAVSGVFLGTFFTFTGGLRGAGETRIPLLARFTGSLFVLLGLSYALSIGLGLGVPGIYAGILLSHCWMAGVGIYGFWRGGWAERAAGMLADRASTDSGPNR